MKIWISIARGISLFNEKLGRVLSWLVFVMMWLVTADVFLRYVFRQPTGWVPEISEYILCTISLLAGGHVLLRRGHVNVDIIYCLFERRTQAIVDIITSALLLLFCGVLIIYGWQEAFHAFKVHACSESVFAMPLFPTKLMIPIGAILLVIQALVKLVNDFLVAIGGYKEGLPGGGAWK